MEDYFIDDIKIFITRYLKFIDVKNFFSLNKNFRKHFILVYHISFVNYSKLNNNFLNDDLMKNIKNIYFDDSFNQQLDNLLFNCRSQSLTSLSLGYSFNQQIEKLS
jgi:hypothetical protein